MCFLKVVVLYFTVQNIIANDITILTDWEKNTLQCMNNFFENTRYLTNYDTNVTINGLDEKGGMYIYILRGMLQLRIIFLS